MRRVLAHSLALLLVTASVASANDVVVTLKGGKLSIKGDADANQITIDGTALPDDTLRITPSGGTTVNGVAGAQTFTGFVGGVTIKLGEGADQLAVFQKTLAGKVSISLGPGSDELEIVDASLAGPSKIDLGGGDDAFSACDSLFEADVVLKLGKGTGGHVAAGCNGSLNDAATSNASAFVVYNSGVNGALAVKAPPGSHAGVIDDTSVAGVLSTKNVAYLGLCYATFTGGVKATMPKNLDQLAQMRCDSDDVEDADAQAGGETAFVMADSTVGGSIALKGGAGWDSVAIAAVTVPGDLTAALGAGQAIVVLSTVTVAGDFTLKSSKINDTISGAVVEVQGKTTVKTGDGDDVIIFTGQFLGPTKIDAGKGNNTVMVP